MSALLTRHRPSSVDRPAGRPLAVNAALAAPASVGVGLLVCWVVALAGWFASDGGAHGQSTSALKVGSGAWLLAHGTDLHLGTAVVTAVPLGLTAFCAWLAFRAARWAGSSSEVEDLWSLAMATVVLGGTYGCLALATAVVTATTRAAPDPLGAFLGAALLGAVAGGAGLVAGSGLRAEFRALLPVHARAVLFGGLVAVLAVWSAGALLAAVAVAWRGESVANLLSRLHVDVAGGSFSLLVVVLIAPNLAAWGASYLLGGGFALGTGTVVSPSGVVMGPVPSVPVLAAVPDTGPGPGWAVGVLAVPVVCGLLVGWTVTRRFPTSDTRLAAARAAGAALLGALTLTLVAAASGGSVGGGRMTRIGPDLSLFLLMAVLTLSIGAVVAAVGLLRWQRRQGTVVESADAALGLERRLPWRDRDAADRRAQGRHALGELLLARHRRRAAEVPGWARLGVWGASTPPPTTTSPDDVPGQRSGAASPDDEDTTYVSR
jgi:hypothetical protein